MQQTDNKSVHKLLLLLIKGLSKLWLAVLLMYFIVAGALFLNMQFDNQKNITTWSELFISELKAYHRKAEGFNFKSIEPDVIALRLDTDGEIIQSTKEILKGFSLNKSALFKHIQTLKSDEEFVYLFPGLTENRLKVYYILRNHNDYIVFLFLPEYFFPVIQWDTIFHFVDLHNTVIYSTNEDFIGTELNESPFFINGFEIFSLAPINIQENEMQKLYIMRNISFQIYAFIFVGITFIINLWFLRRVTNKMDTNLKRIEQESSKLHFHLMHIPEFSGFQGDKTFKEYQNELKDFQTALQKERLQFFENKNNRTHFVNFSRLIISLIDNVEAKITEITEVEGKYRLIFENSREGLFQFSPDGSFLLVNDSFSRLLKYDSSSDFISNRPRDIFGKIRLQIVHALEHEDTITREAAIPCKNNELVELLLTAQAIRKSDNTIQYIHGSIRDLAIATEEQRLMFEKERLLTIARTKNNFLASVSHELRTPLNSVIGFAELLAGKELKQKEKSYVYAILTAGKSLLTLINDVLDLSKAEAGKISTVTSPVSMVTLLKDIQVLFNAKIEQKNIEFQCDIDTEFPNIIFSDEKLIRQICVNLIGNAIKFTNNGFIKILCRAEKKDSDNTIELELMISDSGKGINPQALSTIFEAFSQDGENNEGSGLGLAICKKLVQLLNGTITVNSIVNTGTTFFVRIPKLTYSDNIPILNSKHVNTIMFNNQTVLVVDDEPFNRDLMVDFLETRSLKSLSATNGAEALDIVDNNEVDLILMDIRMPVMNGIEASQKIKSNPRLASIPIIAYTASTVESDIRHNELFSGVVLKPTQLDDLVMELDKHLNSTTVSRSREQKDTTVRIREKDVSRIMDICSTAGTNAFVINTDEITKLLVLLKESGEIYPETAELAEQLNHAIENYDFQEIETLVLQVKRNLQTKGAT